MSKTPNLIYILADDMGYGDASCLNPQCKIKTPNLQRMAAQGLRFTDAHASSAVCTPSRYSILTGRYNWRSRLNKGVIGGFSPALIEKGRQSVASLLRGQGYRTACVGKWHLGFDWERLQETEPANFGAMDVRYDKPARGGPLDCGFDTFFGISASLDMPPYVYIEGDGVPCPPAGTVPERKGEQFFRAGPIAPDFRHEEVLPRLTQRALADIERMADGPFFLYFPLPAPHTPILPLPPFAAASGINAYADFVMMCDDVVGQVMRKLDELHIAQDTILIFTSDNGCSPMADFPTLLAHGHNPSHVFRGHKADIYEGGHRIPLLVRWPAAVPAGGECAQTACLSDLIATMAEITGHPLADCEGEDSVSNLPLWRDPNSGSVRREIVHHSIDGSFSIRMGQWKLEMCPGSGGWSDPRPGQEAAGSPSAQLYRLTDDIGERTNLCRENAPLVEDMTRRLSQIIRQGRSTPGKKQENANPDYLNALPWLL